MSYELILPFFPEELRELLLDPSISDLMINGTTGVFADRNGVVEHIPLTTPYTNERLQAAITELVGALQDEIATEARPSEREPDRLLSIEQAALALGIGRTALYSEIGAGRIRSVKVGRRRLVPSSAISEIASGRS